MPRKKKCIVLHMGKGKKYGCFKSAAKARRVIAEAAKVYPKARNWKIK